MAYRFLSDTVTSTIANAILVDTARGDVITFTRSATYIAAGEGAHVLNLRASANAVIDGALYSADGATVQGRATGSINQIRVGETGLVNSAAGAAFDFDGATLTLFNRGQISGVTGISTGADTTTVINDGAITGVQTGISGASAITTITNHGAIAGQAAGVYLLGGTGGQTIANDGSITGGTTAGVFVLASGDVSVTNSGTIGARIGIFLLTYTLTDTGVREVVNHGVVSGSFSSIYGTEAADSVWNDGTLTGAVYLNGGNDSFDGRGGVSGRVFGGSGDDVLTGSDLGRDVLSGGTGDDRLFGGVGNDLLMPGTGSDYVDGGAGRDILSFRDYAYGVTYAIDQSYGGAPAVFNTSIEGLEGSAFGDYLLGDADANWLYGNAGSDTLDGRAGSDVMVGGLGNDDFYADETNRPATGDIVIEAVNEGIDTIYSSAVFYYLPANVENLTLQTGATYGYGNVLNNVIVGNGSFNAFAGNGGADRFTGAGGADEFGLESTGVATITDFGADDDFTLYRSDGFFALSPGALTTSAYWVGTAAHDADDRLIFNTANNTLYYDADGTGGIAAIVIAVLGTEITPTVDMFSIY